MKVAVIIQRGGRDIIGGAEGYALGLCRILSASCHVDMLTTAAKDHFTWKNAYVDKEEVVNDNLLIKRFSVDGERGSYWVEVFGRIQRQADEAGDSRAFYKSLPLGISEEWIRAQGPYSSDLFEYLRENQDNYDKFIFVTYLYATTYFGMDAIEDKNKLLLIPAYHDENAAHLPIFKKYLPIKHLFLTTEEERVAKKIIYKEEISSDLLGFGLEDKSHSVQDDIEASPAKAKTPYLLYAGRLEEGKGVQTLYDHFSRLRAKEPQIELFTIGEGTLKNTDIPGIIYKGFVSEEEKLSYMRGALALVHPSSFESLSIVLLEAFMMGTPGIVNGRCQVLKDHITLSKSGYFYYSYDEFEEATLSLLQNKKERDALGEGAYSYYKKYYSLDSFTKRIHEALR